MPCILMTLSLCHTCWGFTLQSWCCTGGANGGAGAGAGDGDGDSSDDGFGDGCGKGNSGKDKWGGGAVVVVSYKQSDITSLSTE